MPSGVYKRTKKSRKAMSIAKTGCLHSEETKKKMRVSSHRGSDHHAWNCEVMVFCKNLCSKHYSHQSFKKKKALL